MRSNLYFCGRAGPWAQCPSIGHHWIRRHRLPQITNFHCQDIICVFLRPGQYRPGSWAQCPSIGHHSIRRHRLPQITNFHCHEIKFVFLRPGQRPGPGPSAHQLGTIGFADIVYPRLPIFIAQRSNLYFCGRASGRARGPVPI